LAFCIGASAWRRGFIYFNGDHAMSTQSSISNQPLFSLGQIVATPALLRHFEQHQIEASHYLKRHVTCDFGDLDEEDKAENHLSIERGFRILSAYMIAGERVWLITEADRSTTTLMFASEY
jgi:hypothetical protein